MVIDDNNYDENRYFESICAAFRNYTNFAISQWTHREQRLQALPDCQRELLPACLLIGTIAYTKRFKDYKEAVIRNQFCLDCILRYSGQSHSQQQQQLDGGSNSNSLRGDATVADAQMSKISSVLKSLVREWSEDGKIERDMAYGPLKTLIKKYLPIQSLPSDDSKKASRAISRIVVPGGGTGRLAFDLAALGYSVQGNDFSLYMLLASDFILNNGGSVCSPERPLSICPWLLETCNVHKTTDPLRTVKIPDVDPMIILTSPDEQKMSPAPDFSMAGGDFISVYSNAKEAGQWDCVASCFFLDACPNIVEVLQVIYKMLKPGGLLVNLGPLLYHWSGPPMRADDKSLQEYRKRYDQLDDRYFTSIDLSYDHVKEILTNVGFQILEEDTGVECYYNADQLSMMNTNYQCASFVAKKMISQEHTK